MRNTIVILCCSLFLLLFSAVIHAENYSVQHAGALKNFMRKGDISAKFNLGELQGRKGIYALGAFENLKGEIQIFNSVPLGTYAKNGKLGFDTTFNKKASLLVYMQVNNWTDFPVPESVGTHKQLEKYIAEAAQKYGIDIEKPVPFRLSGIAKSMKWHVIDWDPNDTQHTHKKHMASGPNGTMNNVKAEIIGVYSSKHKAIFTHHSTNVHMHFKTDDEKFAGHIDHLVPGDGMVLHLPKIK